MYVFSSLLHYVRGHFVASSRFVSALGFRTRPIIVPSLRSVLLLWDDGMKACVTALGLIQGRYCRTPEEVFLVCRSALAHMRSLRFLFGGAVVECCRETFKALCPYRLACCISS